MSDVDQGNRYELAGLVAAVDVLAPLEGVHPGVHVVPLPAAGLGLVPVTREVAGGVTPAMICALGEETLPPATGQSSVALTTGPESGFERLTPALLALVEAVSGAGPVAYLETDYTGRDGAQTAAVWRDGVLVLGPLLLGRTEAFVPREAPISQALRMLGVPGDGRDGRVRRRRAGAVPADRGVAGMKLDWEALRERYAGGRSVRPLVGGSTLTATAGSDAVTVAQRLWRADVTRTELEVALEILGDRPPSTPSVPFSEELRVYYSGGPQVQPTCSRTPNLCAVLLKDLGYLDAPPAESVPGARVSYATRA